MKHLFVITAAAAALVALAPASAQTAQDTARFTAAQDRFNNEMQIFRSESDRYRAAVQRRGGGGYRQAPAYDSRYDDSRYSDDDYSRAEPNYDPSRYYRGGGSYQERTLSADERVYAGNDGRYYCKRSDGTTGLVLGAAGGGILGNVIDGGHSRVVGTLLGGALGAVAGKAIDQNQSQVRCR